MFFAIINLVGVVYMTTEIPVFLNITDDIFFNKGPIGSFISIRDYDNDGFEDLLIDNRLFKNVSYFKTYFYEVTIEAGLEDAMGHGTFIDFDDDSCLDIIFYGQNFEVQIYKNLCDGTFRKIENLIGFEGCRHTEAVTFIPHRDFRYGLIYCANYEKGDRYFMDYLYASNGDFTFYDVSFLLSSEMFRSGAPSRCAVGGDLNGDNLMDFYVCNYRLFPNFMFIQTEEGDFINESFNLGASSFQENRDGDAGSHSIGASMVDLNLDGIMDLIISNLAHNDYERGRYNRKSELLVFDKENKFYRDLRGESGIYVDGIGSTINGVYKDELFGGSVAADFNNDGLIDIFFNQVYKNPFSFSRFFTGISSRPYFVESTFATGVIVYNSLGAASLDLNADGCLDLIVAGEDKSNKVRSARIYENVCNSPGDYIGFRLIGKRSGSKAIGSKVRIYLIQDNEETILLRQVESTNSGFGQQNSEILHFGLGNGYKIKHIEVEWNSGIFQILYNYEINSVNNLIEPNIDYKCNIHLFEYTEDNLYLETDCDSVYVFLGNSCDSNLVEIQSGVIDKNRLTGNFYCKDFVLLLDRNGVGVKRPIRNDL